MSDDLNFTALAGMLGETIASTPGGDLVPNRAGTALHYFGDYELEHEIARGGMGVVYRANQRTLNRTVAVKVLRDNALAGGDEVERFKVEAGAAAALRHPHIVSIHEIGEQDGMHFFSMDYVPGGTLAQLLRDGPLPAPKAAALMVKIAHAIQHAHSQGVLHRDLKPANVLLDAAGEPVVTDFGLAKHAAAECGLTLSGQVLGTPAYMAPEQAAGRTRDCGPHTDVYGLGALLYHLCAGRAPFTGDSHLAVITQVTKDEPVSVRLLNPSIPRDLETICARAMAKEIPRRYQSAQELAEDVQRFLDGKPVLARPVGSLGKAWRWARRHRALASSLAVAALSLTGVAVVSLISAQRMKVSRDAEAQSREAAEALIKDMLVGMKEKLRPLNKVELLEDAAAAAERYFDSLPPPVSETTGQQRAAMLETSSDVLAARNDIAGAVAKQRASLELLEHLLAKKPDDAARLSDTAHAAKSLARLLKKQGQPADSLELLQRSHMIYQKVTALQPDNQSLRHAAMIAACGYGESLALAGQKEAAWKIIAPLHATPPQPDTSNAASLDQAAEGLIHLSDASWYAGHIPVANTGYLKALEFAEQTNALQPGILSYQRRLITTLERVNDVHFENGDYPAARDTALRRLVISEALAAADPGNLLHRADVAAAHGRLGIICRELKDSAAGIEHARKARVTYESLAAADPANLRHRYALVTQLLDEALLLKETGYAAAQEAYAKAREHSAALLKANAADFDNRRNYVVIHLNESNLHLYHRNFPAARQSLGASLEASAAMQKDFPDSSRVQRDATRIANTLRDIEAAEQPGAPGTQ
jgi:serine/threonine protein kinase